MQGVPSERKKDTISGRVHAARKTATPGRQTYHVDLFDRNLEVGVVKLVRDVPPQSPKATALLHQGMEKAQSVEQSAEWLRMRHTTKTSKHAQQMHAT